MSNTNAIDTYLKGLIEALEQLDRKEIGQLIDVLSDARDKGKQVFVCGNGGSASTASHMACDLNKGCSYGKDKRFKVICLSDNMATVSAYSNDVSYDEAFVEQLKNFLCPGDVVIGISGSGNSVNVIKAIDYANQNDAITVGLCGMSGGVLKAKAKIVVHAKTEDLQKAEDIHLILDHIAMQVLCGEDINV